MDVHVAETSGFFTFPTILSLCEMPNYKDINGRRAYQHTGGRYAGAWTYCDSPKTIKARANLHAAHVASGQPISKAWALAFVSYPQSFVEEELLTNIN